jgi:hypothetical protein
MNRWLRYPLLLSGICAAICLPQSAVAGPNLGTVTCPVNEDRVWVYDSLSSFDVAAKLHCGDTVEIVSRVKGYVKVRIPSGLVGYMPDSAFPDLPPLSDDQEKLGDHNAAPVETTAVVTDGAPMSLAAAAAAYRAAHKPAPEPAPVVRSTTAPTTTEEAAAVRASKPVAAPAVQAPRMVLSVAPSARTQPGVAPRVVSSAASPIVIESEPEPTPAPAPRRAAAVVASAKAAHPAAPSRPSIVPAAVPPAAPEVAAKVLTTAPIARVDIPPIPAPATMPAIATADASMREIPAARPAIVPESDEYPDTQPENASADPNCRVFFSAYGLGAEQYKWLSEARSKQFSGICPAPNLESVDFVILFTHDTDSYVTAMPAPVHTDGNGFSDFDPMTTVDTALMSPKEADKAHYELAWVFHVQRGAFDPGRFSPRRRPTYSSTAKGSHASTKAVEDAFNFIQQQGPNR